jgi:release factor glutamine methyltransferase
MVFMVYEPREDSLLLSTAVRRFARGRVLDMGTGSGVQAAEAARKGLQVTAVDIDESAIEAARKNFSGFQVELVKSDLFSNVEGRFDTIVFNPPYLPDEPAAPDAALDGGPTGRELLDRFLAASREFLNQGGQVVFVQSSITGVDATKQRLLELGFSFEIVARQGFQFEELVVFRAWL